MPIDLSSSSSTSAPTTLNAPKENKVKEITIPMLPLYDPNPNPNPNPYPNPNILVSYMWYYY